MKIRPGFVSNSSSSSFVLIGKKVQLKDVVLGENKYVVVGEYVSEGKDVFDLTPEKFALMRFFECDFAVFENPIWLTEWSEKVTLEAGEFDVSAGDQDQNSPSTEEMYEYYEMDLDAVFDALLEGKTIPPQILTALDEESRVLVDLYKKGGVSRGALADMWWVRYND